jgi:Na+/melibiose symporter-like transporter
MAAAATLLLAAFVIRERTTRAPLVDLALFRDRRILGANLCAAALGAATGAELILLTLYLQESRGLSPALTGLCFVPQAVGAFSLSRAASKLVPSLGPRRGLAIAMAPSFVGMLGLVVAVSAGSLVLLLVATFVLGIANRLAQVGSTLIGTSGAVATRAEGTASALLTATRQCGAALGVAVSTAVLVIVHGTTAHRTTIALAVATVFALAGVASSFVTPRGRLTRVDAKPEDRFTHLCGGVA